jgi:chromosome segregation ATPase
MYIKEIIMEGFKSYAHRTTGLHSRSPALGPAPLHSHVLFPYLSFPFLPFLPVLVSSFEVGEFDPLFNAITGLNGSGKSNILDAICFVLGISNLSQVRAGSLQELVYKQGQAGVSKASVTLVFDNKDKELSPVGYEDHDEFTVTRQVFFLHK